jgi:hypothetical protein
MGLPTREEIDGKHVIQSPTMGALGGVGALNLIMIVQHVATGGSLLALDPAIIVNGISFAGVLFAAARRYFSDNKPLRVKRK